MRHAAAGWPEKRNIGAPAEPAVSRHRGADLCLRDHWSGIVVEAVHRIAGRFVRFGMLASDPAVVNTFGQLMRNDSKGAGGQLHTPVRNHLFSPKRKVLSAPAFLGCMIHLL